MGRESNKKRRETTARTAREKAAAARADQKRANQRRRATVIISSVVAVAVVAAVIAVIALNHKSKATSATAASGKVLQSLTTVPASVTDALGAGATVPGNSPFTIHDATLAPGGKPTLLYIGAEFCPYCAAQRWAIIEALSRFGTFSGLQQIKSSESNISTFSFAHATYTSKYLNFDAKEAQGQNHETLQQLTSTETAAWHKYPQPGAPGVGFPFMDLDGKYAFSIPMIDPRVVIGPTWLQIADALKTPSSPIAQAVDGAANYITSAICRTTNNQPASVCTPKIQALTATLKPYPAA